MISVLLTLTITLGILSSGRALSNETRSLETTIIVNGTQQLNSTTISSANNGSQELIYYPDEGRGADGYISSFFESFWPFRTHKSSHSFTPSPLLEVTQSKRDAFILDFCKGRFDGDLEDLKKALSDFKIRFNSDLYALHSLLCSEPVTSKRPYYGSSDKIITKRPEQQFVVQSGFSFDATSGGGGNRDYYPTSVSRNDKIENPFFIPTNRRSDSDRSLSNNNRYRRINLNRQSPPKPAIMSDNDVKFYPATVQDFLDAPGRPFLKKLPTLELRQKGPSLSFPHFPRRVAPEQKITPRFPAKNPSTTTPRTTTVTLRSLSKFIAYDANPEAHRKRVVIKPRKHTNHSQGTRRSRIRIPVRKNPFEAKKEKGSKSDRGAINISTIIHQPPNPRFDSASSIKQFGVPQNIRLTPYSSFSRSTPATLPPHTSSTTNMFTPPSTTASVTTTRPVIIQPSASYNEVIQEISAPTSFIGLDEFPFGAKQVVQSEPFLPEEALVLQDEVFGSLITTTTTEGPNEGETSTAIASGEMSEELTTFRVINAEDFQLPPSTSSVLPSIEFKPEGDSYYDDLETIIGDLSDVASPSPVEDIHPKNKGSAQKLAYILIGVCCGLSILCLIVVVVSLGYKSERNFMGEEYRRNLFRRIMTGYLSNGRTRFSSGSSHSSIHEKTSTSRLTGATNPAENAGAASAGTEEQPSHKLGSWFNGKLHNIQTLDRKKKEKVFPTNVYLDNLNDLTRISDSESKKAASKDELENEEDDAFSVEELFESRSKVVSNASSSSPSMSIKSSGAKSQITTEVPKEEDLGDGVSASSFPPPPPPLEPNSDDDETPKKDDDSVQLSDNNDRLI